MKITRLSKKSDFEKYSKELQDFENNFTYPLGNKRFEIKHGDENVNYFTFFEKLGEVSYFIIKDKNKIIGAGCAILKEKINSKDNIEKYWYLGDFKILKEYRNKGFLKKLVLKYFISYYFKSNKMIAVNMSPLKNNGLIKKVSKLFSWFKIDVNPLHFYEWDYPEFKKIMKKSFVNEKFLLFTNNNLKDIVIENKRIPLYHLVEKEYGLKNYSDSVFSINEETINKISKDATFMFATVNEEMKNKMSFVDILPTSESSFISHKIDLDACDFFTGEI